jgi:hypothetical protein
MYGMAKRGYRSTGGGLLWGLLGVYETKAIEQPITGQG